MYRLLASALIGLIATLPVQTVFAQPRLRGMTTGYELSCEDIAVLRSWGANLAAYKIAWDTADVATREEYFAFLETAIAKMEGILPCIQAAGMKMSINLYSPPGGFQKRTEPARHRVFAEQWAQDAILETWAMIATRLKGHPAIFGYDLLNEPAERDVAPGLKNWSALAPTIAGVIRSIDPNVTLIVEPVYGDQAKFNRLKPLPFRNVIYSLHTYHPLRFNQQGLDGRPINIVYPKGKFNPDQLRKNVARAIAYQKKHKVKMFVGEFAGIRWAPKNSAFKYLRDYIKLFEKLKWDWALHAFREDNAWSVEHTEDRNNPNPSTVPTKRLKLVIKSFKKNKRAR